MRRDLKPCWFAFKMASDLLPPFMPRSHIHRARTIFPARGVAVDFTDRRVTYSTTSVQYGPSIVTSVLNGHCNQWREGSGVEAKGRGRVHCSWDQVENTVEISSQPVENKLRSELKFVLNQLQISWDQSWNKCSTTVESWKLPNLHGNFSTSS